ncbi:MAG TPA: hypothetical protein VFB22_10495 [Candidatus Baltobacteraceae bacterium]|nr:hypothetical protein [Candidatus Baltobacteraceae bacterium]
MNERDVEHEVVVICVSYAFILAGAWNDGLLGFPPSGTSRIAEIGAAVALAAEVATRLICTKRRGPRFWTLLLFDVISILTVLPALMWFTFARLVRMVYAAIRLTLLLDRLAADRNNGMFITGVFPFVVPVLAAVLFAIERRASGTTIHNYFDALKMCFAFSLSLGNVRPATTAGMAICGGLLILGLLTIGVLTNTITARYQDDPA